MESRKHYFLLRYTQSGKQRERRHEHGDNNNMGVAGADRDYRGSNSDERSKASAEE